MGTKQSTLTAYGTMSNHNSQQDVRDRAAWLDFARKVRELASRPEYADLQINVDFDPSN